MPAVTPLPLDAMPTAFRGWVADCADRMQCAPDFIAAATLVAAGSIVGNRIAIAPKRRDNWHEVPIFWGLIAGRPGTVKSPALTAALGPLQRFEHQAAEQHANDLAAYAVAQLIADEVRKKGTRELAKLAKEDSEEADRRASAYVAAEAEEPICRRYFSNDPTVPKLGELLRDNGTGLLLLRDELTGFFRTLESDGHEGDRAFFLEGWNGKQPYTVDRIERGTIRIPRHCLSILGGIKPGPMQAIVRAAVRGGSGDDGLLKRFQLAVWPDKTDWRNVDRLPDGQARAAYAAAFDRPGRLDPEDVFATPLGEGDIAALRFDGGGQDLFDDWRAEHERTIRSGEEHPAFEAYLAKVPRTVPDQSRLAALGDAVTN